MCEEFTIFSKLNGLFTSFNYILMNVSYRMVVPFFIAICFTQTVSAQFNFEFCNDLNFSLVDSCDLHIELNNKVIPNDPNDIDSFDIHVEVDLWDDGVIDFSFISDLSQQTSGQIIQTNKVASYDQITLSLPNDIMFSCDSHRVYWYAYADCGGASSCLNDFILSLDYNVISGDTVEYIYNSGFEVSIDDLDFSNVSFSHAVNDCGYQPNYFFSNTGGISPANGLYDYDCDAELFPNVNYHTVYFNFDESCQSKTDSIVLKVYNQLTDYFGTFSEGSCRTELDNSVAGIEVESSHCEIDLTNAFINSCNPYLLANLDDFFPGIDTLKISKPDNSKQGLTTRDLLLMREYILNGFNLSDGFLFAGDYNFSGGISTLDLVLLRRTILLIDPYDFDEPWFFELDYTISPDFFSTGIMNEFVITADYFNTSQPIDDFDFVAYKKGDLDGSYYDPLFNNANCTYITYDSIEMQLDELQILSGETFSLPIILNEDVQIAGVHFGLTSSLVENVSISPGVLSNIEEQFNSVDTSSIAMWANDDLSLYNYTRGEVLFTLTMTATTDFNLYDLFQETLEFPREIYINNNFQTLTLKMADVGLSNLKEHDHFDFQVYPNPFKEQLFLQGGNESIENVTIDIVDVKGRIVSKNHLQRIDANERISIISDSSLSESIYFLRITSDGRSTFKKLLVIQR